MINRTIIALTGPQGSGKDAIANILVRDNGYTRIAFADALRAEVVAAFGCDPAMLIDRDQKESEQVELSLDHCADHAFTGRMIKLHCPLEDQATEAVLGFIRQPRTPRWVMQQWGTEYRKQVCDHLYWRKRWQEQADATNSPIVVPDCRFDDEALYLSHQLHAEIWRVTRPGRNYIPGHVSEVPVANYFIDRWISNDGSLLDLLRNTQEALAYALHSQEEREGKAA